MRSSRPPAICFFVRIGQGCEPLWLGLCRYPKSRGWRLSGFAKTQFASVHGWDHFQRCHLAVIDLLAGLRGLGFTVRITDEGGYWPHRSLPALREKLDSMNALIAAHAGALKDVLEDDNGVSGVRSPMFAHPHFERLEAQGIQTHGGAMAEAVAAVAREARRRKMSDRS